MNYLLKYPKIVLFSMIISSMVISLTVVELILRLFAPVYHAGIWESYQYDQELGYRLKPGIHMFETKDFQEEIRTNRSGTINFQESFDGYGLLVFALGDSYTQGTGLPADVAYPFQLDLILNRDANGLYSKRYGVVNLGLAAFGGEQSLIALRRYSSLTGKPSVVLYLGSDNDYEDDVLFRSGYRHQHLVAGSPYWGWMLKPLQWVVNTEITRRIKFAVGTARRSRFIDAGGGNKADRDNPVRSVAELEQSVLDRIAAACDEYGALLIVSWGTAPSISYDWLKSWAASKGIPFADWWPAVEAVRSSIPVIPLANQHSGGHWRGWVNQLIADAFARKIKEKSSVASQ